MELKLHYSSSSEKRRPGSQTMFTCMDTSYPRRNRRKNLHLECINRSIWTWHEAAQLDCLIVVTGMTRYFTFREQTTCLYAILPVNMEDFLHGWSMWGFKATLSINPPWVFFFFFFFFYFSNCQNKFKAKRFQIRIHQRRSAEITSCTYPKNLI